MVLGCPGPLDGYLEILQIYRQRFPEPEIPVKGRAEGAAMASAGGGGANISLLTLRTSTAPFLARLRATLRPPGSLPGGRRQPLPGVLVKHDAGGRQVLLQVPDRGGAGNQQDIGREVQGPGQRD